MTTIMRYDPFREALSLRDAMNQLFTQSFVSPYWVSGGTQAFTAPIDVLETDQGYELYLLLPGMKHEDIELTVQQNTLTIKGQLNPWFDQNKQAKWLMHEISYGTFERTITFPRAIDADKIETSYENGVLHLWVPISEASLPKKISIKSGSQYNSSHPQQVTVEAGAR